MPQPIYTGRKFRGIAGHLYDVVLFEKPSQGLGFDWSGLINTGGQLAAGLILSRQQQQGQPTGGQAQFDQAALQVNEFFRQLYNKPVGTVTADEVAAAEQAIATLDSFAQQLGLTALWNSGAYRPAYLSQLQQIRARMAAPTGTTTQPTTTVPTGTEASSNSIFGVPLWALAAVAGVLILSKR